VAVCVPAFLRRGERERLLAQHVLARLERGDGDVAVQRDGGRHRDQVEVVATHERLPVVRCVGDPEALGRLGHLLGRPAAERDDLVAVDGLERRRVHDGSPAHSDDPHT
jgi:hypothetical protein